MRLERESSDGVAAGHLLERSQHSILIEAAVAKVGVGVGAKLELPALLGRRRINPEGSQAFEMVTMLIGIHNVNRLMATLEPFFNEGQ